MVTVAVPVIDYAGSFHIECPPNGVWAAIEQVDRFEGWWPWLSGLRVGGAGLKSGVVLHGIVSPPVPYRMCIDVELVSCRPPRAIDAAVHGDLRGSAHLRLRPEGSGTRAEVNWSVEMMQPTMRLACRVAHPLLQWGHDRVVDSTLKTFRQQVEPGATEEGHRSSNAQIGDASASSAASRLQGPARRPRCRGGP